ncbi:MAG: SCO family protein [Planctomycetota bacterium]
MKPALTVLTLALLALGLRAQVVPDKIEGAEGVGIDEKLGTRVPLDLAFRDEAGAALRLGDLFRPGRPVLLTLNYSDCPMLCSLQLNGLAKGLHELAWSAGAEFLVVTVAIDPKETFMRAAKTAARYREAYGRPGAEAGWRFLTGDQPSITALADAVGFRYKLEPETGIFYHQAAAMLLSPDGKVCRYLYGIEYPARDLRLGITEAGEGTVGTVLDKAILYCFPYDPDANSYAPAAIRLMKLGGAAFLVLCAGVFVVVRIRKARSGHGSVGVCEAS